MNPSTDSDEKLARLIGDTLRRQPSRRAPDSLAARVLREIEVRATTPWWRRNFAGWPVAARAVFVLACVAVAKLAVDASIWLMNGLDSAPIATNVISAVRPVKTLIQAVMEIASAVAQHIPSWWIYGGIAALAVVYAALFGLGAAAYRTLYVSR